MEYYCSSAAESRACTLREAEMKADGGLEKTWSAGPLDQLTGLHSGVGRGRETEREQERERRVK